jgi:dTDP-4-dehydrorhamnose 3,5-epimerase
MPPGVYVQGAEVLICPVRSQRFPEMAATLGDFRDDAPFAPPPSPSLHIGKDTIEGVEILPLTRNADKRGALVELSIFDQTSEPLVHVYQVFAAPGSIRAWVYHKRQYDRLAYTDGKFEVVLFDLRPKSATYRMLNVFHLGAAAPSLVRIPPFVVHGVRNAGEAYASFVNMPTRRYDPATPDKSRLPQDDPRIPYEFE